MTLFRHPEYPPPIEVLSQVGEYPYVLTTRFSPDLALFGGHLECRNSVSWETKICPFWGVFPYAEYREYGHFGSNQMCIRGSFWGVLRVVQRWYLGAILTSPIAGTGYFHSEGHPKYPYLTTISTYLAEHAKIPYLGLYH